MAQSTFNNGDSHGVARTAINNNANDAESRLAALEAVDTKNAEHGWANFADSVYTEGSPLQLNAGNSYRAKLTCDGLRAGTTTTEWASGLTLPWDTTTNKFVATNAGDKFTYRLNFKAQNGAQSVLLDIVFDIGGAIGEISRRSQSIAKGASAETSVEAYSSYFTGSTFVANGGEIFLDASFSGNNVDIWEISLLIEKTYTA